MITFETTDKKEDLQEILNLQKANLKKNLSKEDAEKDGFVTVDHDWESLIGLTNIEPHAVAKDNGKVVGYVLAMTKKSRFDIPLIAPMFNEFKRIPFRGKTIADFNYMVVGQTCVHKDYRGQGLIEGLFQHYKTSFSEHYEFSITEIASSNIRSLKAHQKWAMKSYIPIPTHQAVIGMWYYNPKLKEARMPVILHEELADKWLTKLEGDKDQKFIEELIQEYPQEELEAHTVSKLRGKDYMGNVPGISDPVKYGGWCFNPIIS
ncbi:GNAT family N-acetyltransferase [Gelidibacter gilvus]|uniref:GNAT family N-acetyltransferase n=1 Tax=Gelidibacter gilvus TaxID=59602 RepID=A0A4Q0XFG8_9FLAO|nr:GNAT family N-acetyltransferase [Gelidibacter gilvus]RXJ49782.1 GNAT family N-acetyltransferase [Gelidibacter gilvus]